MLPKIGFFLDIFVVSFIWQNQIIYNLEAQQIDILIAKIQIP